MPCPGTPVKPIKVVPRTARGRGRTRSGSSPSVPAGSACSSTTRASGSTPASMACKPIDQRPGRSRPAAEPAAVHRPTSSSRPTTSWSRSSGSTTRRTGCRRSTSTRSIQPKTTFATSEIGSVSGLITLEDGEVSGREPRSLTLDGRQELHGRAGRLPVPLRGASTIPRGTLKVGFVREASGAPFRGFPKPLLETSPTSSSSSTATTSRPGRTKVFKAALELRTAERSLRTSIRS